MRTLAALLLQLGIAVVAVRAAAQYVAWSSPPPSSQGPVVAGTVCLANGSLAGLNRSMPERFAALVVHEAEALGATNLPDLVEEGVVTHGLPPPFGCQPQVPTVSICVANVGAAAAGAFSVSGQNLGAHYEFFRLDGLGAGEHTCIETAGFPLDAEVMVTVDSNNEVQESSEDNNTRWEFVSFAPAPTCSATPMPATTPTPTIAVRICGQLVQGVECVLLRAENAVPGYLSSLYLLSNEGGFHVGDRVCVTGDPYPCISICQEGNFCFNVTTIEAVPTPTPTPIPTVEECNPSAHDCPDGKACNCCCGTWVCMPPYLPCCAIACAFPTLPPTPTRTPVPGECGSVCDGGPCTGLLIRSGTCQPDGDHCTCVTNTPAPGECALACDSRPCVGQCPDGSTASGFCTFVTIDTGCRCALACSMPVPTPTPTTPCTGVPCGGSCAVCAPCTPGTICPNNCGLGTCEMVSGSCGCVPGVSTPTATPAVFPCVGDCGGDGVVTVDEIVRMVTIALNGQPSPNTCSGSDQWCSSGPVLGAVGITCLVDAVNNLLTGCPTTSPTATPTRTPLVAVFYQLAEGSTILSSPAGSNGATLEEPLSGMFIAVPQPYGGEYCLNVRLCLAITNFQFHSAHFFVEGSNGRITQPSFEFGQDLVFMGLTGAFISSGTNGQVLNLGGDGPLDHNSPYPPTFRAVEICAAPPGVGGSCAGIRAGTDVGYDIMIFAMPEG